MRLIDADALLKKKDEIYIPPEDPEETWCFGANIEVIYIDDVKDAPTIDAVPVVHGRWDQRKGDGALYRCSACGEASIRRFHYCPECGAKVDGEREIPWN